MGTRSRFGYSDAGPSQWQRRTSQEQPGKELCTPRRNATCQPHQHTMKRPSCTIQLDSFGRRFPFGAFLRFWPEKERLQIHGARLQLRILDHVLVHRPMLAHAFGQHPYALPHLGHSAHVGPCWVSLGQLDHGSPQGKKQLRTPSSCKVHTGRKTCMILQPVSKLKAKLLRLQWRPSSRKAPSTHARQERLHQRTCAKARCRRACQGCLVFMCCMPTVQARVVFNCFTRIKKTNGLMLAQHAPYS